MQQHQQQRLGRIIEACDLIIRFSKGLLHRKLAHFEASFLPLRHGASSLPLTPCVPIRSEKGGVRERS
jgi:hypothetical protein